MKMIPMLDSSDLAELNLSVLVMGWHRRNDSRRHREAFHAAFTEREQRLLANIYLRAYRWVVLDGYPKSVAMQTETVSLIDRAVKFFAEL